MATSHSFVLNRSTAVYDESLSGHHFRITGEECRNVRDIICFRRTFQGRVYESGIDHVLMIA